MKRVACMMRHRAIEATSSGICPDRCGANSPLRKSERKGPTMNPPPTALYAACDWKLMGMLTGTAPDCGRQDGAAAGLLMKDRQTVHHYIIFWGHVRSSKRLRRHFCRNRYFFLIKLINKFSSNLRSESARSTLKNHLVQLGLSDNRYFTIYFV